MVQDFKDPSTAQLAVKAFEETIGKTFMMNIVEKIHVTDVRDIGDINHKTEVLEKIFATGKKLAGQ